MDALPQPAFLIRAETFEPPYLHVHRTGELKERASVAIERLAFCRECPRNCGADRLANQTGVCQTGRFASVSRYGAHFGEENCLSGTRGSGTIFFSWCNLRCPFCQNHEISHDGHGEPTRPERLAGMMLELQGAGCHNINLVSPSHVVPQILEALVLAVDAGLNIPLVYNTSAYDSFESLRLLDGIVDIYMPDFKFWDSKTALKYLAAKDYPAVARRAIREMYRQVGDLKIDEHGLARRGLLLRHLVMPGSIAGTREIAKFLALEISPHTYITVMAHYFPSGKVLDEKFSEINRCIKQQEYVEAIAAAQKAGLYRFAEL